MKELELTNEQLKAAKAVYRAMRKAAKLNVHFWDNYGNFQCYNGNKIKRPMPDPSREISIEDYDPTYSEETYNFHAGNSDDPLFFDRV